MDNQSYMSDEINCTECGKPTDDGEEICVACDHVKLEYLIDTYKETYD